MANHTHLHTRSSVFRWCALLPGGAWKTFWEQSRAVLGLSGLFHAVSDSPRTVCHSYRHRIPPSPRDQIRDRADSEEIPLQGHQVLFGPEKSFFLRLGCQIHSGRLALQHIRLMVGAAGYEEWQNVSRRHARAPEAGAVHKNEIKSIRGLIEPFPPVSLRRKGEPTTSLTYPLKFCLTYGRIRLNLSGN